MKKLILYAVFLLSLVMTSCASSSSVTTIANGNDLTQYKYVIFGSSEEGDAELNDISLIVQNEISNKLQVVSSEKALSLMSLGNKVLTPKINIKSEKWEGGYTYITISFYDFETSQMVAVVKSSGIGWSIAHDQKLALEAIKKELDKTFK